MANKTVQVLGADSKTANVLLNVTPTGELPLYKLTVGADGDLGNQVSAANPLPVDTELETADLDTGAGTDTQAAVGLLLAGDGGGVAISHTNPLPTHNPMLDIAIGNRPDYSSMNKFGENPDVDSGPEDIWDFGGLYNFSATADIDSISSDNDTDTQDVMITGLDENWDEVSQTITMTGQTRKDLDTPLIRVYRAINMGTVDIAGNVYIYPDTPLTTGTPTDTTKIRAMIRDGNNQTLMCVYSVPAGKTAYFMAGYVAFSKGKANAVADFSWRARPFGSVFQVKSKIGLSSTGSSTWSYTYGVPVALPEKADIVVRCDAVNTADSAVAGGFDLVLVDN